MHAHDPPWVLGLIPARRGSKGIRHKNLRPLAGRPLIQYTCAAALASRHLTQVLVSTDCPRVAAAARADGVQVPFRRPSRLAGDTARSVDVIQHALHWLAQHQHRYPDIVALLQPTAPLREGHHIDEAIGLLLASDADSVVSVTPVPTHYHPEWQFCVRDHQLVSWTGTPLAQLVARRQDLPATYSRNGALYVFWTRVLQETGSLYGTRCLAYVMPPEVSVNIDTVEDWRRAERLLGSQPAETPHGL
ncbi:MAG: hypothetical protein A2W31_13180 [Planctomycetes bacterium RBG_16_64_10]|nr:MAG: hypothetical protein A2W31_13180 [Planctomycetes bacterium RBG_16_64_10]